MRTSLIAVSLLLAVLPASAQQFRNADRAYAEAEHLCKRLFATKIFFPQYYIRRCIATRLGLRAPVQPYSINGNVSVHHY